MTELGLELAGSDWRATIERRQARLEQLRRRLIRLEAALADQLSAISAFEFEFRSRLRPLLTRLENIQGEINECLRQLHRESPEELRPEWENWSKNADGVGSSGGYRFWEGSTSIPRAAVNKEQSDELKQLYRQLARRFHPAFAANDDDRAYCTQLMMAINAAYALGDLERLKELMKEPDVATRIENATTDQQLAAALQVEIARCRRRIHEIEAEMATLKMHNSAVLLERSKRAAARGQDFIADVMEQLRRRIQRHMVERDALRAEVESLSPDGQGLHGDAFADVVWNLSLDQVFDEDPEVSSAEWIMRDPARYHSDDDILDDAE